MPLRSTFSLVSSAAMLLSVGFAVPALAHSTCSSQYCCSPHGASSTQGGGQLFECDRGESGLYADYSRQFYYAAGTSVANNECGSGQAWCGCSYQSGYPHGFWMNGSPSCISGSKAYCDGLYNCSDW